jgi:hypothetical protein
MTPDDEKAFELLHALRAIAAAWWVRARYTRVDLDDPQRWREKRRLEERAFFEEELPAGHTWIVPSDEDVAASVLPPIGTDPALVLPVADLVSFFESRAVRLLHVATGNLRHIEEPLAWICSRGWCPYDTRRDRRLRRLLRASRPGAWRLVHEDPPVTVVFARLCAEAWEGYLVGLEWELAADDEGRRGYHQMRSPSGAVYGLQYAVDVALARGGFDVLAELARGDAAAARAIAKASPKAARKSAAEEAAR